MTTRISPKRTSYHAADKRVTGEWSAWEAIRGATRQGRLEALLQPGRILVVSMAIIGLLALLYLYTTGEVALANSQLQNEKAQQLQLERQDQQLHLELGQATSPAYIDRAARKMGLEPGPGTQP